MPRVKVLGVDPALANLGLAYGTVDTRTLAIEISRVQLIRTEPGRAKEVRKSSEDYDRARILVDGLRSAQSWSEITMVEMPIGSQSAAAMKGYGISIAVIASAAGSPIQVSPAEVKATAVGSRVASKAEMIAWAHTRHPSAEGWITQRRGGKVVLTAANEHLADAIAAIYAGVHTAQFRQAVAMAGAFATRTAEAEGLW